jgi:hypothetical protein
MFIDLLNISMKGQQTRQFDLVSQVILKMQNSDSLYYNEKVNVLKNSHFYQIP